MSISSNLIHSKEHPSTDVKVGVLTNRNRASCFESALSPPVYVLLQ